MDLALYAIVRQIIDLLQRIVNALKSVGQDMLNVNTAGADIMQPVDVQGSTIMVPADWQGVAPEAVKSSITLLSSTTQTASGSGSDVDIGAARNLRILVKVTAVSGTSPTLRVCVQGKQRATGDYEDLVCTDTISATGLYYMSITNTPYRVLRVRWEIGGTSPSFTFGVYAEASL